MSISYNTVQVHGSVSVYVCVKVLPVAKVVLKVWLTTRQSGVSFGFLPGSQILHDQENLHPISGRSYIRPKKKKSGGSQKSVQVLEIPEHIRFYHDVIYWFTTSTDA